MAKQNEGDFYRDIISRSRRFRERAADSLRRVHNTRRSQGRGPSAGTGEGAEESTAPKPQRGYRRQVP